MRIIELEETFMGLNIFVAQTPNLLLLLGEGGFGNILEGIDFIGIIFGALSQFTFLVDVFVAAALIAALLRGIFKNFWKVLWRGVIFVALIASLFIFINQITPYVGNLPLTLAGEVDGVAITYTNLGDMLKGLITLSGESATYADAMSTTILQNITIFLGVPLIALLTPMLSAITFPLINLLIPKKMKKLKFIPIKLAISVGFSLFALIIFAFPMRNLVPTLIPFQATMTDGNLLQKFLNPEVIGFMRLFTSEHSIFIKIVEFGNVGGGIKIFSSFADAGVNIKLDTALTDFLTAIDGMAYSAPTA